MEGVFLVRYLSPVLSRGCCSKPLAIKHFKHGETTIPYGYCGTVLRMCSGKVKVEGKKDPALILVPVGQFVWKVSLLHSSAASKVARHLKHSLADPCEPSFVQILVKQVF